MKHSVRCGQQNNIALTVLALVAVLFTIVLWLLSAALEAAAAGRADVAAASAAASGVCVFCGWLLLRLLPGEGHGSE